MQRQQELKKTVQRTTIKNGVRTPTKKQPDANPLWSRLATGLSIQAKLTVGAPNDEYEQEADAVSEQVMRMPAKSRVDAMQKRSPEIQSKINGMPSSHSGLNSVHQSISSPSGGSPLNDSVRSRVEPVLRTDLSAVRVHSGASARDASSSINARAFTHKNNIFIGQGESSADLRLMAHEATHTVQQTGTGTSSSGDASNVRRTQVDGVLQRNPITEANLPSPTERGISAAERDVRTFMRDVYRRQVAIWVARGAAYVHQVASTDRTTLPSSYVMPGRSVDVANSIVSPVQDMVDAARSELTAAGGAGSAANIEALAVRSGYRSASSQFSIWRRFAPRKYYRDTWAHRQTLPGGEHGARAAQYLAEYTNQRVFSPGYSPHQSATAVDLTYKYRSGTAPSGTSGGGWAPASSDAVWINHWRRSWFFGWLWQNAPRFGFMPNRSINEPWHWEYRPVLATVLSIIRWLFEFIDTILGTDWSSWFEGRYAGERGPVGDEEMPPEE